MTENNIRNRLFLFLMVGIISFLIPFEIKEWADSALVLYGLCLFFVNGCLFIWVYWWFKSTTRSDMFTMVGLLLFSIDIAMVMQFYARWEFIFHPECYRDLLNTDTWAYRVWPELVILIWFFSWAVGRFFGKRTSAITDPIHNDIRKELSESLAVLDARIVDGELRFMGHRHVDGNLVIDAKLIVKL
jgi:hypothetical protein